MYGGPIIEVSDHREQTSTEVKVIENPVMVVDEQDEAFHLGRKARKTGRSGPLSQVVAKKNVDENQPKRMMKGITGSPKKKKVTWEPNSQ